MLLCRKWLMGSQLHTAYFTTCTDSLIINTEFVMVHKGLKFCVALDSPGPSSAYQDHLRSQFHLSACPIAQKVPSCTLLDTYYLPQLQFTAGTLTSGIDLSNTLPIYCRQTSNFSGLAINGVQYQQLAHSLMMSPPPCFPLRV